VIDLDFIKRAAEIAKPQVDEYLEKRRLTINRWNKENPIQLRSSQRKYEKKECVKRKRNEAKRQRWNKIDYARENLSKEEWESIGRFLF